jgi:hypothetical protein
MKAACSVHARLHCDSTAPGGGGAAVVVDAGEPAARQRDRRPELPGCEVHDDVADEGDLVVKDKDPHLGAEPTGYGSAVAG